MIYITSFIMFSRMIELMINFYKDPDDAELTTDIIYWTLPTLFIISKLMIEVWG